ncbi:ArnT family glycosyltransferase [Hydrogenimonas sp.]
MRRDTAIWLLMGLAALTLFFGVGDYGVVETSDARYAEIAREMLRNHEWLHPPLLEIHHYHKPPLTYWLTALGYELFGVNPFGARFFLQLSLLVQLYLVYKLAQLLLKDSRKALYAAAIYLTFPLALAASRNLTTDSFLTTFTLLSLFSWVKWRQSGRVGWLYLFALGLGLGFMTKGPVIFIFLVPFTLAMHPLLPPQRRAGAHALGAVALFLVVGGWWYLYLVCENPAFLDYFLGRQTIERFSSKVFHRQEPWYYFLLFAPLVGLPWLATLGAMLFAKAKRLRDRYTVETALAVVAVVVLIFFSLSSSKRILYILPLMPLLAILCASLFLETMERFAKRAAIWHFLFASLVALATLAVSLLPLKVTLGAGYAILALSVWALSWAWMRRRDWSWHAKALVVSVASALLLLVSATGVMARNPQMLKVATPIADYLRSHGMRNRAVLVYDIRLPSLAFTLDRPVISLYDGSRSLDRERQFETNERYKAWFYDLKDRQERQRLRRFIQTHPTVLVLRGELPTRARWLKAFYTHHEKIGKFTIYFTP